MRLSRSRHGTVATLCGGVATYEDVYKLTYVRGRSSIIVMLAQDLRKS